MTKDTLLIWDSYKVLILISDLHLNEKYHCFRWVWKVFKCIVILVNLSYSQLLSWQDSLLYICFQLCGLVVCFVTLYDFPISYLLSTSPNLLQVMSVCNFSSYKLSLVGTLIRQSNKSIIDTFLWVGEFSFWEKILF